MKSAFYLITIILLISSPGFSTIQAQENITLEVEVGFDSFYKVGAWTPVRVEVVNAGSANLPVRLQVLDEAVDFGAPPVVYAHPLDLPAQSHKQVTLYLPLRGQHRLQVELAGAEGPPLLTRQVPVVPLEKEDFLIGVLASQPSLLNGLGNFKTNHGRRVVVAHLALEALPAAAEAWTGLDLLVFNDVDTGRLTPAQQELLQTWVRFGGRLLVGGGPNAAQTIAGLSSLLPFSTVTVQTWPHPLAALEAYQPGKPLPDRGPYVAAVPTTFTGQVLAAENNLPLIISQARGLGQVCYLALDLGLAPLDTFLTESLLLPAVVGPFEPKNEHLTQQINKTEMVNSLALIPGQTLPSIGTVIGYLALYVFAVGPVNYVILSRFKKKEWAWLSIPLIIFVFSAASYTTSFRLRSGRPLLRQITVVQSEIGAPWAEAAAFVGIYSPQRTDYTLAAGQPLQVEALPAQGYDLTGQMTVSVGQATTIDHIRGDIGGVSGVVAYHQTQPPQIDASLVVNRFNRHITGSLTNQTGRPITDVLLVINNSVVKLDTLPVGETRLDQVASEWYGYYGDIYLDYDGNSSQAEQDAHEQLRQASRETAVRALLGQYDENATPILAADHVYLIGWQEGSLFDFKLSPASYDQMDETLFLVRLPYTAE